MSIASFKSSKESIVGWPMSRRAALCHMEEVMVEAGKSSRRPNARNPHADAASRLVGRCPKGSPRILRFIAEDNPLAAERVLAAIKKVGQELGDFASGRPGRVRGTYER